MIYSETLHRPFLVTTAKISLVVATGPRKDQCISSFTSKHLAFKYSAKSEIWKHSINDQTGVRLISAPPAFFGP